MNATVHSSTGFAPAAVIMPGLDTIAVYFFSPPEDNENPVIENLKTSAEVAQ
jgi:hypothetical protein